MKTQTIGLMLIILGVVMMIFTGLHYFTTENIFDIGPIQINQKKKHQTKSPSIPGGLWQACGVVIIVLDKKETD